MMLFLFAEAAPGASAGKKEDVAKAPQQEEMATVFEADPEQVITTYKGGVVKRKEIIVFSKAFGKMFGVDLNKPMPKKILSEMEKVMGESIALQKYIETIVPDSKLSEDDRLQIAFIRGQFITQRYAEDRAKQGVTDDEIRTYYADLREKVKEKVYSLLICIVDSKEKAEKLINTISANSLSKQKDAFKKAMESNAKLTKVFRADMLKSEFGDKSAAEIMKYAKNTFVPKVFEMKGQYSVVFVEEAKNLADQLPPLSENFKEVVSQEIVRKNMATELKKIKEEGDIQFKG